MQRIPIPTRAASLLLAAALLGSWHPVLRAQTPGPAGRAPAATSTGSEPNRWLFEGLDLPDPDAYRTGSGEPGPSYWQQDVDYEIDARLDPETHRISATEIITYTNQSPSTLERLWLQLDQNLFDPSSRGARITPPERRFSGAFPGGGYDLASVELLEEGPEGGAVPLEHLVEGTTLRVELPEPIPAEGGRVRIRLEYAFAVPAYGADRMGRFEAAGGTVYEIAQWYPRVFTYDDLNGWNVKPYLGQGEFYLEYGDFDVRLTVPRNFLVVATGRHLNPEETLTATQRERLERARGSATTVTVVGAQEVGDPSTRPPGEGPLTWRFRAENVRDFAWAASRSFVLDAAGWENVLILSAYPEEGIGTPEEPGWERSTEYARHAVRHYSETLFPYPYPVAINVAGVVGGMEYPMIVFCSVRARGRGLFGVTDHELGHSWFPMIVGSDERRHAWLDEGLNTFINHYSRRAFYGAEAVPPAPLPPEVVARLMASGRARQPVMTLSDRVAGDALGFLAYRKPGFGLWLLREYVLGPERFDPAFRAYVDRWAYRHPSPADFFRTIEDVAGEDLDWFWQGWFGSTERLDAAVAGVEVTEEGSHVVVEQRGGLVLPLVLELRFAGGATERRRIPVEAFHASDRWVEAVSGRHVVAARLDPDGVLPDGDRANDGWEAVP